MPGYFRRLAVSLTWHGWLPCFPPSEDINDVLRLPRFSQLLLYSSPGGRTMLRPSWAMNLNETRNLLPPCQRLPVPRQVSDFSHQHPHCFFNTFFFRVNGVHLKTLRSSEYAIPAPAHVASQCSVALFPCVFCFTSPPYRCAESGRAPFHAFLHSLRGTTLCVGLFFIAGGLLGITR